MNLPESRGPESNTSRRPCGGFRLHGPILRRPKTYKQKEKGQSRFVLTVKLRRSAGNVPDETTVPK